MSISSFSVHSTPLARFNRLPSLVGLRCLGSMVLMSLGVIFSIGCAEEIYVDRNAPVVLELEQQEVVVGESVFLYGKD